MRQSVSRPSAGLVRRFAAILYDWLLLASLMFAATLLLILVRGGAEIAPASWWYNAFLIALSFLFFGWCWTHGGQTLGMRAWKIRVERYDGGPLDWPLAIRRYMASWILLLPPGLGFLWGWLDRDGLCWHDRLSSTRVVRIQG
ncbi:MAG: RDD family protein [Candidatus Rariloculaceae bacterium]